MVLITTACDGERFGGRVPILRAFCEGGIAEYAGEGSQGQSGGIPHFAKSAKDGAPDRLWQSKGSQGQSSGIPHFAKSAKDRAPDRLWQSKGSQGQSCGIRSFVAEQEILVVGVGVLLFDAQVQELHALEVDDVFVAVIL